MKAVIYTRFSSDRRCEESIEGQIRECTAYARQQGITVIDTPGKIGFKGHRQAGKLFEDDPGQFQAPF